MREIAYYGSQIARCGRGKHANRHMIVSLRKLLALCTKRPLGLVSPIDQSSIAGDIGRLVNASNLP